MYVYLSNDSLGKYTFWFFAGDIVVHNIYCYG